MRIVVARRISQGFFVALLVWLCLAAAPGQAWWQLRGWPVNWFLQLDPLLALGTLLTTGRLYSGLLWALATVVLTLFLGRFFCGWVCPFGAMHHFLGWLGRRRRPLAEKVNLNRYRQAQSLKYYLLVFLLAAAAGGLLIRPLRLGPDGSIWPSLLLALGLAWLSWLVIRRLVARKGTALAILAGLLALWTGLAWLKPVGAGLAGSLQTGLLDPLPLVQRSINLIVLPLADAPWGRLWLAPRWYEGAWLIGGLFLAALLLNLVVPRFYCRFVCPLGALFGLLAGPALWRLGRVRPECRNCLACEADCEGACQPSGRIRLSECVLCFNCLDGCADNEIAYQSQAPAAGLAVEPELSRRGFLAWLGAGLLAGPMLRLPGLTATNPPAGLIRPPGALAEAEFLRRCTKCGQCLRVCPTNIIQPALLQAGLEGLWTPALNFRAGTSGCQLNCVACGQVCPTAAIRPLSLAEKLGRDEFFGQGPVRLGTAFIDRGRCLPWALDRPCLVCEENCPVSPKAIFTRTLFQEIRGGRLGAARLEEGRLDLEGDPPQPERLASGDYYCRPLEGEKGRRLILAVAGRSLTLAPGPDWSLEAGQRVVIEVRLQQPFVEAERCIGCGICEHECPVAVQRAVRVSPENESRSRRRPLLI